MRDMGLYRGKRLDNGEWVEGYYCFNGWTGQQAHFIIPDYASAFYGIRVIPESVSQYTGLCDRNGKRIFEGDIVRHHDDIDSEVLYNTAHCAFILMDINGNRRKGQCDKLGDYCSLWIEVTGTIHDQEATNGQA